MGLLTHWRNRYYCNPFQHATSLEVGRVDMGVDYFGTGPIRAMGRARIIGDGGAGWPGGHYLAYTLLRGKHKGRHVYVAEAVTPVVKAGQVVKRGQMIARFAPKAAPGKFPGIETGWSSPTLNRTLAAETGQTGGADHADSPAGVCFARFLHHHGAPAPLVPNQAHGLEYPRPLL